MTWRLSISSIGQNFDVPIAESSECIMNIHRQVHTEHSIEWVIAYKMKLYSDPLRCQFGKSRTQGDLILFSNDFLGLIGQARVQLVGTAGNGL